MIGAKRLTPGIVLLRNEQQAANAATLASYWIQGMPADYARTYLAKTEALTTADVQRVGHKYFDPKHQSIVVVGDPKAIDAQLKPHGDFKVVEVK